VLVGSAAERPKVRTLALLDRRVVDAGDAPLHQTGAVELAILVTVAKLLQIAALLLVLPFSLLSGVVALTPAMFQVVPSWIGSALNRLPQ
jgi:hypothetical protein